MDIILIYTHAYINIYIYILLIYDSMCCCTYVYTWTSMEVLDIQSWGCRSWRMDIWRTPRAASYRGGESSGWMLGMGYSIYSYWWWLTDGDWCDWWWLLNSSISFFRVCGGRESSQSLNGTVAWNFCVGAVKNDTKEGEDAAEGEKKTANTTIKITMMKLRSDV